MKYVHSLLIRALYREFVLAATTAENCYSSTIIATHAIMPGETDDLQTVVLDPRGDILLNIGSNESEDSRPQKTLRACSRALARVSPVFDRMLYGSFAESKRPSDGLWTIDLPEDDPAAFELMARIAHGLVHDAPESLSIDQFYELTTLTHYYDCSHILTPWAGHWINVVLDGPDDMPFWAHKMLWISWELRDRRIFEATARNILMETPCSLSDRDSAVHDLQMPPDIIGKLPGDHVKDPATSLFSR